MDVDKKQVAIGIIVAIFIIYLFIIWRNFTLVDNMVTGFWVAPPDFCEDTGIDAFLLYIGDRSNGNHPGYIIIQRDGDVFLNQPTNMSFAWDLCSWQNWSTALNHTTPKHGVVRFDINECAFPNEQCVVCYPTCGKMILSKDDTIYAVLYRSSELTEQLCCQTNDKKIEESPED